MTGSSPVGPDGLGEGGREFETLTMGDKRKQIILAKSPVLRIVNALMLIRIPDPTFHRDADPDPAQAMPKKWARLINENF